MLAGSEGKLCAPPRGRFPRRGGGGRYVATPHWTSAGMSMDGRRATYLPTYPPDCLLRTYLIGLWIGCWQTYHPFPALTQPVPRPTRMDDTMAYVALFEFGSQKMETTHQLMIAPLLYAFLFLRKEQHNTNKGSTSRVKYFPGKWLKCELCVITLLQGQVLLKVVCVCVCVFFGGTCV